MCVVCCTADWLSFFRVCVVKGKLAQSQVARHLLFAIRFVTFLLHLLNSGFRGQFLRGRFQCLKKTADVGQTPTNSSTRLVLLVLVVGCSFCDKVLFAVRVSRC